MARIGALSRVPRRTGSVRSSSVARTVYTAFAVALGLGCAVSLLVAAAAGAGVGDGLRFCLYLLTAAMSALILGLIFGVPRTREGVDLGSNERYAANSNLEQISDWLTKLLLGAGLVQLGSLPDFGVSLGNYLGAGMETPNAGAVSVAAVAYGMAAGFLAGYLWTRLRLRIFLEEAEQDAAEAAATEAVETKLKMQNQANAQPESQSDMRAAARSAVAARGAVGQGSIAPILWVDDVPANNRSVIQALEALDIEVSLAESTDEGLQEWGRRSWGLVITDLGRKEPAPQDPDHYNPDAGLDLINQIREHDDGTPIYVFGTHRAVARTTELMAAKANLVTDRASVLFENAVKAVTMPIN